jgi:CRISPR-associated protein Cas5h
VKLIAFRFRGRLGHFLRAEANASAPSYPLPPRTALLGLLGAVLGLEKDQPQESLAGARLAVGGRIPDSQWHVVKLRKDPPPPLPFRVKKTDKGSSAAQDPTLIRQQWLWKPDFRVHAALPGAYHDELAQRLRQRRWHFSPCLGLSEMGAELVLEAELEGERLPAGLHRIESAVREDAGELHESAFAEGLALRTERLPCGVTPERVFTHARCYIERDGRPIPFVTDQAWQAGAQSILFL